MWIESKNGIVNTDRLDTISVYENKVYTNDKQTDTKWLVRGLTSNGDYVTFDEYEYKLLADRQVQRLMRQLNGQPIEETDVPLSKPEEPKKSKYDTDNPRVKCIKITDDDDIEKMAKMICDALGL